MMKTLSDEPTAFFLRDAEADDLSFIYSTWLHSLRTDSYLGRRVRNTIFFTEYPRVIDRLLADPLTKVTIAYFPEAPRIILSYIVYSPETLHYVFTKELYRSQGIAKHLFDYAFIKRKNPVIQASHLTKKGACLLENPKLPIEFNPFILFQQFIPKEGTPL